MLISVNILMGVSKTRGRGRGRGLSVFFFQHHRSFVGQIRIKANIKKLSLKLTSLGSSVTTYSGGHWFLELTTFILLRNKMRQKIQGTRQYISLN